MWDYRIGLGRKIGPGIYLSNRPTWPSGGSGQYGMPPRKMGDPGALPQNLKKNIKQISGS